MADFHDDNDELDRDDAQSRRWLAIGLVLLVGTLVAAFVKVLRLFV